MGLFGCFAPPPGPSPEELAKQQALQQQVAALAAEKQVLQQKLGLLKIDFEHASSKAAGLEQQVHNLNASNQKLQTKLQEVSSLTVDQQKHESRQPSRRTTHQAGVDEHTTAEEDPQQTVPPEQQDALLYSTEQQPQGDTVPQTEKQPRLESFPSKAGGGVVKESRIPTFTQDDSTTITSSYTSLIKQSTSPSHIPSAPSTLQRSNTNNSRDAQGPPSPTYTVATDMTETRFLNTSPLQGQSSWGTTPRLYPKPKGAAVELCEQLQRQLKTAEAQRDGLDKLTSTPDHVKVEAEQRVRDLQQRLGLAKDLVQQEGKEKDLERELRMINRQLKGVFASTYAGKHRAVAGIKVLDTTTGGVRVTESDSPVKPGRISDTGSMASELNQLDNPANKEEEAQDAPPQQTEQGTEADDSYQGLLNQVQELEMNKEVLLRDLEAANLARQEMSAALAAVDRDLQLTKTAKHDLEQQLAVAKEDLATAQLTLTAAGSGNETNDEATVAQLQAELNRLKHDHNSHVGKLEQELQSSKQEAAALREQVAALAAAKSLVQLNGAGVQAGGDKVVTHNDGVQQQLQQEHDKHAATAAELSSVKQMLEEASMQLHDTRQQLTEKQDQIQQCKAQMEELQSANRQLQDDHDKLQVSAKQRVNPKEEQCELLQDQVHQVQCSNSM